jgi:hypothetical protein
MKDLPLLALGLALSTGCSEPAITTGDAAHVDAGRTDAAVLPGEDAASPRDTGVDAATLPRTDTGLPDCAPIGAGHCWYATPDGTGDCSVASPCTIEDALPRLGAGDVLYLREGTYTEYLHGTSGEEAIINFDKYFHFDEEPTADAPLTIRSYPGERATLQGDYRHSSGCVFVDGASHLILEDLDIERCWQSGVLVGYDLHPVDVTVRGCEVSEIVCNDNMGGVFASGTTDLTIENNTFHDMYYEGTQAELHGPSCRGGALIFFRDTDLVVRGNEIYDTCSGMYYKHGEGTTGDGGTTLIEGNYLHDLGGGRGIASNQNRSQIVGNHLVGANIVLHNEDGTRAPFTFDASIERNTVVGGSITFPEQQGEFPGPRRTTVRRNVLYDSEYHVWTYGSDAIFAEGVELVSDQNCFFVPGGHQEIDFFGSDNPAYGGTTTGGVYSLGAWQSLDYDLGSVEADPQFAPGDEHRPTSGSPCETMGAYAAP